MPDNRTLLIIVLVAILGIFGFLAVTYSNDRSSPQTLGEAIDEAAEEIGDEIDDHTTSN